MRSKRHGSISESNPDIQAWLATGYLCSRTEAGLESIRTAAGVSLTQQQLCEWVGEFFLSKARGALLDSAQHLPQVRGAAPEGYAFGAGPQALHVHPRGKRALTLKARKAIGNAQRERWAKFHAQQAGVKKGRPKLVKNMSAAERREYNRVQKQAQRARMATGGTARGRQPGFHMKKAQVAKMTSGIKNFWASMTKAERSAEMSRRRKVADAKKAGKLPPPPARGANGASVAVA